MNNQNIKNKGEAVDMVATAQAVQQTSDAWRASGVLKLVAPAKVNLFLGIGDRRDDGLHEAISVLHAVALHDVLYLRRLSADAEEAARSACVGARGNAVSCGVDASVGTDGVAGTPDAAGACGATSQTINNVAFAGESGNVVVKIENIAREGLSLLPVAAVDNIVFRAVDELARALGRTEPDALEFRLEKHIPHEAGLGGGSSDAAAALLGVARLWGVDASSEVLERVAHRLGSDVAFFLHGGCAYFDGAGERFCRALEPMKRSLVLVKPEAGMSTAAAYRAHDEAPVAIDAAVLARATQASSAADVPLFNNLAVASERLMPELSQMREWAQEQSGVEGVLMCGSGSTTFAVFDDFNQACRMAAAAQARGWWARTTTFGSLKAAVAPVR